MYRRRVARSIVHLTSLGNPGGIIPYPRFPINPSRSMPCGTRRDLVATDLHFLFVFDLCSAVDSFSFVKSLRTISHAILSLVMAASFLMMSFAASVHELSHLQAPVPDGSCAHAELHSGVLPASAAGMISATADRGAHLITEAFCFLCIHTPSVLPAVAHSIEETFPSPRDVVPHPAPASLHGYRLPSSSPRAPPSLG